MNEIFIERVTDLAQGLRGSFKGTMNPRINHLLSSGVDSFESLFKTIQSPSATVQERTTAIWLAGRLGNTRAVTALVRTFFEESNARLFWEAGVSLGLLKSKRSVARLLKELETGDDDQRRSAAAYALGLIGDDRAGETFAAILNKRGEPSNLRSHVAEALGRLGSDKWNRTLVAALYDESEDVVYSSVYALGENVNRDSIRELEIFLNSESARSFPKAREEASRIIHSFKNSHLQ
jgi:HEAT repeat protein